MSFAKLSPTSPGNGKKRPSPAAARAALLWKQSGLDAKAAKKAFTQNNSLQCGYLALQAAIAAMAALAHHQREPQVIMYSLSALLGQCSPSLKTMFAANQGKPALWQRLTQAPLPPTPTALETACLRLEQAQHANPFSTAKATAQPPTTTRQQARQYLKDCHTIRSAAKRALGI